VRLLYLIDSLAGGGAESVLANLLHYLAEHEPQVECHVATLYPTPEKSLAGKNFPVHCLDLPSKYAGSGAARLVRFLRAEHFDLVHVHLFPANYFAAWASLRVTDVPWIYTEHSMWNRRRRFLALRALERIIYSRFERIVAVSESVARSLIQWLPSVGPKVRVIPNGVLLPPGYPNRLPGSVGDRATILFVGRLEYVKGVDVLLRALAALPPSVTLWLAGAGAQRAQLEQLADTLGISDRVKFLGFRTDVQQLMIEADCLVLPSRWEGLPMVVLEAMAGGTPVVASAVGGIPEVIEDGVTGWLVPPEDPASLAQALITALGDSDRRRRICDAARARVAASYSIDVMAQRTLALYAEVLGQSVASQLASRSEM